MGELKTKTIAAIAAGAVVLAGVGLGVTQPWKQDAEPAEPAAPPQEDVQTPQKKADHFLTIGGKQVPSVLHEGDGWSILYPETWQAEGNEMAVYLKPEKDSKAQLIAGPGTMNTGPRMVSCYYDNGSYNGDFEKIGRVFYPGDGEKMLEIDCYAPVEEWEDYKNTFAAIARSFTLDGEQPFQNWSPLPEEPQWQESEGVTVLWLDKDGFVLDEPVQKAVEEAMRAWDTDYQSYFTGQYRVDAIAWQGSFTNLDCAPFVEAFGAKVWYQLSDSAKAPEEPGVQANVNGWYSNSLHDAQISVLHDGSAVTSVLALADGTMPYPHDQAFAGILNKLAGQ